MPHQDGSKMHLLLCSDFKMVMKGKGKSSPKWWWRGGNVVKIVMRGGRKRFWSGDEEKTSSKWCWEEVENVSVMIGEKRWGEGNRLPRVMRRGEKVFEVVNWWWEGWRGEEIAYRIVMRKGKGFRRSDEERKVAFKIVMMGRKRLWSGEVSDEKIEKSRQDSNKRRKKHLSKW